MIYGQFYKMSTGYIAGTIPPQFAESHCVPIAALGSDSVYIVDGRRSLRTAANEIRDICKKRGFIGFTIHSGANFSNSRQVRFYESVPAKPLT